MEQTIETLLFILHRKESTGAEAKTTANTSCKSQDTANGGAAPFGSTESIPVISARDKPTPSPSQLFVGTHATKLTPIESGVDLATMGERVENKEKETFV